MNFGTNLLSLIPVLVHRGCAPSASHLRDCLENAKTLTKRKYEGMLAILQDVNPNCLHFVVTTEHCPDHETHKE